MTPNEYQQAALRTFNTELSPEMALLLAAVGLAGEVGEIVEPIKKHVFHGKGAPERADVVKECGDVLWYLSLRAHLAGVTLEEVMETNIAKLRARYPNKGPRPNDGYYEVAPKTGEERDVDWELRLERLLAAKEVRVRNHGLKQTDD